MSAALHSVLAASEPSKVPFYVMGGILASWAVVLSVFGLSRAGFPATAGHARAVMAISAVLVLGTVTSAVATSSKHHEEGGESEAKAESGGEPGQPPPPPPPGGGAPLKITADPGGQLKYVETSLTAKAGKVTIDFDNPSPVDHNVTITGVGQTKTITNGKTSAVLDIKPGTYTYFCSVDAHRQAGMEGKLTVS